MGAPVEGEGRLGRGADQLAPVRLVPGEAAPVEVADHAVRVDDDGAPLLEAVPSNGGEAVALMVER